MISNSKCILSRRQTHPAAATGNPGSPTFFQCSPSMQAKTKIALNLIAKSRMYQNTAAQKCESGWVFLNCLFWTICFAFSLPVYSSATRAWGFLGQKLKWTYDWEGIEVPSECNTTSMDQWLSIKKEMEKDNVIQYGKWVRERIKRNTHMVLTTLVVNYKH